MIHGHVIALDPTVRQRQAMLRACGVARFTYNWALHEWNRQYRAGQKPSGTKLKKQFNAIKGEAFPWIFESPRDANAGAFSDLDTAFSNYIKSITGKRQGPRVGPPNFKKKGKTRDAFYVANDKFHFLADGKHVHLPVIGSVKTREPLRLHGKILGGRVKRIADRWYLSVQVEGDFRVPNVPEHEILGIDLGLKTAVVPSRGEPLDAPKPLRKALKKLRRANRKLHRRQEGSANRRKAREELAKIHRDVANIRKDFLHKTTTKIARETQAAVIEGMNVAGMLRNHSLARALSDVGMGMFRTLLIQKGPVYGCEVIVADRWFPSSKTCSGCGVVKAELSLGTRTYECEACGLVLDRDRNAALNLEAYPRLSGNSRKATPVDTAASTRRPQRRASVVAEAGAKS